MSVEDKDLELATRMTTTRLNLLRRLSDLEGLQGPDLLMELEKFVDAKIALAKQRN